MTEQRYWGIRCYTEINFLFLDFEVSFRHID